MSKSVVFLKSSSLEGLPVMVQRAAEHIAKKAVELDIVPGRSPITVAAASIYMACEASEVKKTIHEIAESVGVATTSIRSTSELLKNARELFPCDFPLSNSTEYLP